MLYTTGILLTALLVSEVSALTEDPKFMEPKGWKSDWTHVHVIKALNILEPEASYDEMGEEVEGRALFESGGFRFMKKCLCVNTTCGCCGILPIGKTNVTACLDAYYMPGEAGFTLKARFNNISILEKPTGKCGDMCKHVPLTQNVAKLCVSLNDVVINNEGMHGCLQVHLLLFTFKSITMDFNCLLFDGSLLKVIGPSRDPDPSFININVTPNKKPKLSFNIMSLFRKSKEKQKTQT